MSKDIDIQSTPNPRPVVVAGHLCLDIIPTWQHTPDFGLGLVAPGHLVHVGSSLVATGGAVSNTGLALHRLGINTRLVGLIGDDLFGQAVLQTLRGRDPALTDHIITINDVATSYTIVISPPDVDRSFLHCAGTNDEFNASHLELDVLRGARWLHFGYPPLMRSMHQNNGDELQIALERARSAGLATSLDLAHVDPNSLAGSLNWRTLLAHVLPGVDIITPNFDETFSMLDPEAFSRSQQIDSPRTPLTVERLQWIGDELLEMGVAMVLLKLGRHGIYFRSAQACMAHTGLSSLELSHTWWDRELLVPAFQVVVAGTTGAGDCAVAGFLAALLRGYSPEGTLTVASAVGACNVERVDAISGVLTWTQLCRRLQSSWPRHEQGLVLRGWEWDRATSLWRSPRDQRY